MWRIKRRELEVVASKNFTLPRLDALVTYRLRGFGNDLAGDSTAAGATADEVRFASAFKDLGRWDHQEWEGGFQFNMPLGFRQGWAGVRQSELQLARERAILKEQQRQVALQLGDAIAETSRSYEAVRAGFNRLDAARQDLTSTLAAYNADQASVELVLDSQQRLAEAQSRYYRSLTDHALSLKNVHLRKGSLLQYNEIHLDEGPWPMQAYRDAAELKRRWRSKRADLYKMKPGVISRGPFSQRLEMDTPTFAPDGEEIETPEPDMSPASTEQSPEPPQRLPDPIAD
jgi:hypothetical protein